MTPERRRAKAHEAAAKRSAKIYVLRTSSHVFEGLMVSCGLNIVSLRELALRVEATAFWNQQA
jgi:hypothetical protein